MLKEESRIVRRQLRGEDSLINLVIYLIDVRAVLRPVSDTTFEPDVINWSASGLFDEPQSTVHAERQSLPSPRLSKVEVDIIRRIANRANVLPVLAHADALTISELDVVRKAVRRDLADTFGGELIDGTGVFGLDDKGDGQKTPKLYRLESEYSQESDPADIQDQRPPTPPLSDEGQGRASSQFPFAIFAPDPVTRRNAGTTRFHRRYPWGEADAMDPKMSDFLLLRDAVLGVHAKDLRTTTKDVLYERYRTETLLAEPEAEGGLFDGFIGSTRQCGQRKVEGHFGVRQDV